MAKAMQARAKSEKKADVSLKLRNPKKASSASTQHVHIMKQGVRCETDTRGHETPRGQSRLKLVVDASEGFIPLWAKDVTLRWRFRESSFAAFENPASVKATVEKLLAESILAWGDAAPVKFAFREDAWDFEILVRKQDDCDISGCVLASAFFPDAGRHQLVIYPKLFLESWEEQVETMVHEIGHVFGLRHFFAQISETSWPAEVFGKHSKFSIMNYGGLSRLTAADREDLKNLYGLVWAGKLTKLNGTKIKLMKPFHASGVSVD